MADLSDRFRMHGSTRREIESWTELVQCTEQAPEYRWVSDDLQCPFFHQPGYIDLTTKQLEQCGFGDL